MPAPTIVASAAASTTLLAAGSRAVVIIENTDANRLHILLDSGTASTTNYSFSLAQNEKFELRNYRGIIKGIWAADGAGSAFITELL